MRLPLQKEHDVCWKQRVDTHETSGECSTSSSGRSSKILKDHTHIGTVVEVAGVGRLVLDVTSGGCYSLRAYPEGSEEPGRSLLAVGVVHADEIIAINPEGLSAVDGE